METFINQFMHIYFWVYLFVIITQIIDYFINGWQTSKKDDIDVFSIISVVLFIMSFKY